MFKLLLNKLSQNGGDNRDKDMAVTTHILEVPLPRQLNEDKLKFNNDPSETLVYYTITIYILYSKESFVQDLFCNCFDIDPYINTHTILCGNSSFYITSPI